MRPNDLIITFANWILRNIYDADLLNEIQGDLLELYIARVPFKGKNISSLLYLWDAIHSARNIGLKKKRKRKLTRWVLLSGYFKLPHGAFTSADFIPF
ncbi:MAG: permease prefix domain 2-containing transporter [Bacteroidota bacterium]